MKLGGNVKAHPVIEVASVVVAAPKVEEMHCLVHRLRVLEKVSANGGLWQASLRD